MPAHSFSLCGPSRDQKAAWTKDLTNCVRLGIGVESHDGVESRISAERYLLCMSAFAVCLLDRFQLLGFAEELPDAVRIIPIWHPKVR